MATIGMWVRSSRRPGQLRPLGLLDHAVRKDVRDAVLVDGDQAEAAGAKDRQARCRSGPTARRAAGLLARTRSPGCASPTSEMMSSRRSFFSTGSPELAAFLVNNAEDQLAPLSVSSSDGRSGRRGLLGAREDAVADAERAVLAAPLHHPQARRRHRPPSARHGKRPLSSTSTTRSTVTLGRRPSVEGPAGAAGSGLRRPCRAQYFQRDLHCLSRRRAISRLPPDRPTTG